MKTEIFNYNGNPVTFKMESSEVMVSATEMAKHFGKQPVFWLNNNSTTEFLNELSKLRNLSLADLVIVSKGGNNPGTWFHEDVAIEFARWLSPRFGVWCNDKIKELLKNGVATVNDDDEVIARAIEVLQNRYNKQLERNEQLSKELNIASPKAEYYDEVLMCDGCYTTTLIAKELGMSAITLNEMLFSMKIQYRQSGVWLLYSKYQSKGYTKTHTKTYTQRDGKERSRLVTVWTEEGREFIHKLIKKIRECGDLIE